MSFRIEKKFFIEESKYLDLLNLFNKKKILKIYNKRVVNSIYFENKHFDMFNHSEEGILPRKKIRLRWYGDTYLNNKLKIFKEIKINSIEGKFKISKEITFDKANILLKYGIFDKNYGLCKPKIKVCYQRQYYAKHKKRFTIDKNINYLKYFDNSFKTKLSNKDNEIILEIKSNNIFENFDNNWTNIFVERRFSKYSRGVKSLKICK